MRPTIDVHKPCINCPNRYPGCHSKCESYIYAKETRDRLKREANGLPRWELDILAQQRKYGTTIHRHRRGK